MTNTPVTQIIEELDKRIADLESARNFVGIEDTIYPSLTGQIRVMKRFWEYALTMLPVEKEQKENDFIYGLRNGGSIKAQSIHQKQASDYFKSNYNQYAGDNNK